MYEMQYNRYGPDPQQHVSPTPDTPLGKPYNTAASSLPNIPPKAPPNSATKTVQTPPPNGTPSFAGIPPSSNGTPPLSNGMNSPLQAPGLQAKRAMGRAWPRNLERVDDGKVVEALKNLRANCEKISPNEIYLVLNPSGVAEAAEAQFSQKAQIVEGWRNGLILLPIMLTWISLGLAGQTYTQSISANPKLVAEPLLQQWGEGFTALKYISVWTLHVPLLIGTWRYFSFGDVAVLDFLLFVLLLLLTIRAQSIEAQASKDAIELGTWLREECDILREHTFARVIGQGPGGDAPEWAVLVNKSIADLQRVMDQVERSVRSFDAVLKDDREAVSKALKAVDNLNAIYEAGRRTYEQLEAILPRMDTSFENMAHSQEGAVRSLDSIATAVNASSNAVVELARPFATIGVGRLAKETFTQLDQIRKQQEYVQNSLVQQMAAFAHMKNNLQQPPVHRWWDVRRFFRTPPL